MTSHSEEPVAAAGTIRRVQALGAAGYPQARLANWFGLTEYRLARLLTAATVPVPTARVVAAVFDQLCLADPALHGVDPVSVRRAKARAVAAGWAPVGAWDDDSIDDPAAAPNWTGHCGTVRGVSAHIDHGIPLCPPCRGAEERRRLRNVAHERRALFATRA
ncbi:hypothetical protein ACFWOX_33930 [Streptomyces sp. NPDC058467]|uniref:hypothetical protein n=1 Tax=Streptomyces sp. NPDC058467 TaxID=3346513 RepID=UPI00365111AD